MNKSLWWCSKVDYWTIAHLVMIPLHLFISAGVFALRSSTVLLYNSTWRPYCSLSLEHTLIPSVLFGSLARSEN